MSLRPAILLTSLIAAALLPPSAVAAPDARHAVVFIRVVGDLIPGTPEDAALLKGVGLETTNVELGTGTGFLVSPTGYLLTCSHVVVADRASLRVRGVRVNVRLEPRRYEVLFPDAVAAAQGIRAGPYDASLVASDGSLDAAVLVVNGAAFPFLHLGDSDAVDAGEPVQAVGFPFGRDVELGRAVDDAAPAPEASTTSGTYSAARTDAAGVRRWLQVTAVANPGNSGGPLVDQDGFVIGLVSQALRDRGAATGITFAVSINQIKEFLERRGLDAQLSARRLDLGPLQILERKGLRLRTLQGASDASLRRTRVEASNGGGQEAVLFRADRVVSPWPAQRLAQTVIEELDLGGPGASAVEWRPRRAPSGEGGVTGVATLTTSNGQALRIEYRVVDLGQERVVARYLGPAEAVAFNASLLRSSLSSVEAGALNRPWSGGGPTVQWGTASGAAGALPLPIPSGWTPEPGGPVSCATGATVRQGDAASPERDFSIELRGAFVELPAEGAAATAACGEPAAAGGGSYRRRLEWLGVAYVIEGRFLELPDGRWFQLEALAPAARAGFVSRLVEEATGRLKGAGPLS